MNSNKGNSRSIENTQTAIHQNLSRIVTKHLNNEFKKPIAIHNQQAFEEAQRFINDNPGPIILDSGCGVGASTNLIAHTHPTAIVLGIDQSEHRLSKHPSHRSHTCTNYRLFRADLVDFWRLAMEAGWQLHKHFLLYPNPWPKRSHLQRRWHGSPVFPTLLTLGGQLELRSNWRLYCEEFSKALSIAGYRPTLHSITVDEPITPFERKYWLSQQTLHQLNCNLDRSPYAN